MAPSGQAFASKIDGSEYLASVIGRIEGDAPEFTLDEEKAIQAAALAMIRGGHVESAHDISDGGLAICLAEKAIHSNLGAAIDLTLPDGQRLDAMFFGEAQSRIVLSAKESEAEQLYSLARSHKVQLNYLGVVTNGHLEIKLDGQTISTVGIGDLKQPYFSAIPEAMKTKN